MATSGTSTGSENRVACLTCRQRKVACDRQRPQCSLCRKNDFDCQYVPSQHRPGLRAGYVSKLEQRLSQLESRIVELERRNAAPADIELDDDPVTQHTMTPSSAHESASSAPTNQNIFGAFAHHTPPAAVEDGSSRPIISQSTPQLQTHLNSPFNMIDIVSESASHHHFFYLSNPDDLSLPAIIRLCIVWFEKYHQWFPILHQNSLLDDVSTPSAYESSSRHLVINAILAVTIQHDTGLLLTPYQKQEWSKKIQNSVLVEAMSAVSLQSLQALLILSILDYGHGKMNQFRNSMAICRSMSDQMGLQAHVVELGSDYSSNATVAPRSAPLSPIIVEREEKIRAYWMTETLDSMSMLGANWTASQFRPININNCALPCSDSLWTYPDFIINVLTIGQFRYSSAFSLLIILVAVEVQLVHEFLQRPCDISTIEQRLSLQSEAQRIDESLTSWREEFIAGVFRLIHAEFAQEERSEMGPNIVLTNCVLNGAVVSLFQQWTPCPTGIRTAIDPWTYATNRCVYASENMAAKIRRMTSEDLQICNPHLITMIFVAARFFIVWSKALDADVPGNLHSLAYALHVCGQLWPLASRYETIIRTAVAEHRTPLADSKLPIQFYDLQCSAIEIDSLLQDWVKTQLC